jgi:tetratricopeptide (TPR) repeat protein
MEDVMRRITGTALCLLLLASSALAADKPAKAKDPSQQQQQQQQQPTPPSDPSKGEMIDNAKEYHHCIALARQKPDDGWEEALAWTSLGGGEPARHCAAIALIGLKQFEEAATRLETLARDSHSSNMLRAGMLAQAGQSWLLAKQPEKAYADQTAALKLVPDAPDVLVDRSQSLAEAKNYREALADLNKAVEGDPKRVDALVFRATAKRFLDDLAGAKTDLEAAKALNPLYQDTWLESGINKRLTGDDAGARQDWLKVLEIAPDTATADAARRNIEMMDVEKVKQ